MPPKKPATETKPEVKIANSDEIKNQKIAALIDDLLKNKQGFADDFFKIFSQDTYIEGKDLWTFIFQRNNSYLSFEKKNVHLRAAIKVFLNFFCLDKLPSKKILLLSTAETAELNATRGGKPTELNQIHKKILRLQARRITASAMTKHEISIPPVSIGITADMQRRELSYGLTRSTKKRTFFDTAARSKSTGSASTVVLSSPVGSPPAAARLPKNVFFADADNIINKESAAEVEKILAKLIAHPGFPQKKSENSPALRGILIEDKSAETKDKIKTKIQIYLEAEESLNQMIVDLIALDLQCSIKMVLNNKEVLTSIILEKEKFERALDKSLYELGVVYKL